MSHFQTRGDVVRSPYVARLLDRAKNIGTMSRAEERIAIRRAQRGDEDAMERLVVSNMLLVYRDVVMPHTGKGVDVEDLMQEAMLGLREAVLKYDLKKHGDKKFMTYGKWRAVAKVNAHFNYHCSTVRVHWQAARDAAKAKQSCIEDGVPLTDANLSDRFDGNWERVGRPAFNAGVPATSVDTRIVKGDRKSMTYAEAMEGEYVSDDDILGEMDADKIAGLRYLLDVREMRVLEMRYGLGGREPMTLEEVGRAIGRTRERARQIQEDALDKLRKKVKGMMP